MKRILSLCLAVLVCAALLCACAPVEPLPEVTSEPSSSAEAVDDESKPAEPIKLAKPEIEVVSPKERNDLPDENNIMAFANSDVYSVKYGDEKDLMYKNDKQIGEYDSFSLYYTSSPHLVIGDLYFVLRTTYVSDIETTELFVYNLKDNSSKAVYTAPHEAWHGSGYLYQLSESEVVFAYKTHNDQYEHVVVYNFVNDESKVIYSCPVDITSQKVLKNSVQWIDSVSAHDGKIYLLKRLYHTGKTSYSVICLDNGGNLLYEDSLDYLSEYYSNLDTIAAYFGVYGDYIFTSLRYPSEGAYTDLLIAKKVGDSYTLLDLGDHGYIAGIYGAQTLIDDRYLVFEPHKYTADSVVTESDADLVVFDVKEGSYRLLKYDVEKKLGAPHVTRVDEKGNILIGYQLPSGSERQHAYYTLPYEQWK